MSYKKVEITEVHKSYRDTNGNELIVLNGVSLKIGEGECVACVGPSGCGKTTLLRVVAGIESLNKGKVSIDGRNVDRPQVGIGIVFQHYSSFPWLTVEENIALGLQVTAINKHSSNLLRVQKIICALELSGFEKYYPSQLSGGMRQRVAVGRALVSRPPLLLMDEPFGALDIRNRIILQKKIIHLLVENGTTALIISHDIEDALLLADRVLVFSERPAMILKEVSVPGKRPRKESERLYNLKMELRDYLLRMGS